MFSLFGDALNARPSTANAAQETPRQSLDHSQDGSPLRSIALSATSSLAESALSNLRKTISAQRGSPAAPLHASAGSSPTRELEPVTYSASPSRRTKLSLEERLKASLAKEQLEKDKKSAQARQNGHPSEPLPKKETDPLLIPLPPSPPPGRDESYVPETVDLTSEPDRGEESESPLPPKAEDLPMTRLSEPPHSARHERSFSHPTNTLQELSAPRTPPAVPASPNYTEREAPAPPTNLVSLTASLVLASPFEPVPQDDPLNASSVSAAKLQKVQSRFDGKLIAA